MITHVRLPSLTGMNLPGLDGVVVSGGEPTLRPDLRHLVWRMRGLGFRAKLDTNGTRPAVLQALIDDGLLDYIALDLKDVPRAIAARNTKGLMKLVADQHTGKLLGTHILAAEAGDVIQEATLAIRFGLRVQDLVDTFHPYLTMAESLKLAALTFTKDVKHLSCCAA
jgi:organic radical activating enzyme